MKVIKLILVGGFIGELNEVKESMYEHIDSNLWEQIETIDYSDIIY